MAFFFLFTGLLMGTALISLSESERDYYDRNRVMMNYMGSKDGYEVFKDPTTNTFYVDDGWDVRRVGSQGFIPHPVDKERLQQLCTKYNPENLRWVEFLLASYEGKEQVLWQSFFEKYELGPKPKEPTWGKGIRKARWADYENQVEQWEARKRDLLPVYKEECRKWDEKRRAAGNNFNDQVTLAAGNALLHRALSSQMIYAGAGAGTSTTYQTTIPQGLRPGDTFLAKAGGQTVSVVVPPNTYPGQTISFVTSTPAMQIAQPVATTSRADPVPPAIPPPTQRSAPAPVPPAIPASNATQSVPPPAIEATKPLESKSSMIW